MAFFAKTSVQQISEAFVPRGRAETVRFSFSRRGRADPARATVSCRGGSGCALSLQELYLLGKKRVTTTSFVCADSWGLVYVLAYGVLVKDAGACAKPML